MKNEINSLLLNALRYSFGDTFPGCVRRELTLSGEAGVGVAIRAPCGALVGIIWFGSF